VPVAGGTVCTVIQHDSNASSYRVLTQCSLAGGDMIWRSLYSRQQWRTAGRVILGASAVSLAYGYCTVGRPRESG
jgi:hypothetical protein